MPTYQVSPSAKVEISWRTISLTATLFTVIILGIAISIYNYNNYWFRVNAKARAISQVVCREQHSDIVTGLLVKYAEPYPVVIPKCGRLLNEGGELIFMTDWDGEDSAFGEFMVNVDVP